MNYICQNCKTENLDEAKFCRNCGADILKQKLHTKNTQKNPNNKESENKKYSKNNQSVESKLKKVGGWIIAILVFLLIKAAILTYNRSAQNDYTYSNSTTYEKVETKESKCIDEGKYLEWNAESKKFECVEQKK